MGDQRDALLFLCVANSARSQMAEALARAIAPAGTPVFSAGSSPSSVNPLAVRAVAELGLTMDDHRSKSVDDVPRERVRTVVTLCAEEVCPLFPGEVQRIEWALADPAAATASADAQLEAFREMRDEIRRRLGELFGADARPLPVV